MKKKVWLINHNAQAPSLGGLCRHYYFKKYTKETDFEIKIITSSFIHNTKIDMLAESKAFFGIKEVDGEEFVFLKTNQYKNNSLKRKLNFLSFAWKLKKLPKKLKEIPDLIYASTPDIFAAYYAVKLAKKLKVPCVVEVRDLWPESIIEYSGFSPKNPLIKIMYKIEKWIYKNATSIVFTTEGEKQYILDKGWEKEIDLNKCYYINNGVDFSNLNDLKENFQIEDEWLNDRGLMKCTYIGSIRKANHVQMIVDAAKLLKTDKRIVFLFFGDGTERETLEKYCKENDLKNCRFYGKVDSKYIPYILSKSDVNILNYRQANTLKYGGSQNKLFDYLASGKPIISTVSMNYNLIEEFGCGVTLKNYTVEELVETIKMFFEKSETERLEMGQKGIVCAEEFDYKSLAKRFIYVLEKTLFGESNEYYKVYEGENK